MNYKAYFYLITFFAIILTFSSCSKKKIESNIEGTWEYVWLSKNDSNEIIKWTFSTEPVVEQITSKNDIDIVMKGNYFVEKKSSKFFLNIDNLYTFLDGKYRIIKVNDDFLIIQRILDQNENYAFDRFEFVKVK